MQNTHAVITPLYSAFNRRDINAALAFMSENVDWPRASEGGRVIGKEGIRAYWTRQWKEFDPHVDPTQITTHAPDRTTVKVHQLVRSLSGEVLFDGVLWHVYTLANGLVERMDIHDREPTQADGSHPS